MSILSGEALLNPELLRDFSDRIAASLEAKPLKLERDEHRRLLADLLARVGQLNHYELLGIEERATDAEIYDGYLECARLVHPGHVPRLGLEGLAAGPKLLFERATLAYLTLSDEQRRLAYHVEIGLVAPGSGPVPVGEERQAEEREVAERNFKAAKRLADQGEHYYAIELLYVATRMAPRAAHYALLAHCQSQNPLWLRKAIESYHRALELDPSDDASRLAAAELYEREGNTPMARREYMGLLERVPGHPDAVDALKRLKR